MNTSSIATNGMAGATVLVACWALTSRFGIVFPEYIVAALVTLTVGVSHGVTHLLTQPQRTTP
jgi:hypothetical protein